jgi:hypothetical protein
MEKKKNRAVIAGVIILLIVMMIAAVFIVNKLGENIPRGASYSIGFHYANTDGSVPIRYTQYADDGNFSFLLTVEPSADCMLMALVDYRVVPFYFDGRYNSTHYLAGSPMENNSGVMSGNYSGLVSVTNLSEGFHDVLILGMLSPYNYTSSPLRSLTGGGSMRFNVIVGNATKPSVSFENRSTAFNAAYSSENHVFSPLSKSPLDNRGLFKETVKPGTIFNYYVNVGHGMVNNEIRNTSLAIVQLLDYRQLPVVYGTRDAAYYGYIDRSENCSVYMSFKVPETVGLHRLVNIVVTDPYADLELASGIINTGITTSVTFEHVDINVVK